MTNRFSYDRIEDWINDVKDMGNQESYLMLVANKSDLMDQRVISEKEGVSLAEKYGMFYFETSGKTNVDRNV